jgi:DNA-binding NtrC family response regulator
MTQALAKRRLLIVDDDPDVLASLAAWFDGPFDVITAADGVEALAVVDARPIDVIVLDLMMPNMDGAAFKRALDARGLVVPVILASAASDVAGDARRLGVVGYVVKPIDLDRLEAMVVRAAGGGGPGGAAPAGGGHGGRGSSGRSGGDVAFGARGATPVQTAVHA